MAPSSVTDTRRVVRFSKRAPSRVSSICTAADTEERGRPRLSAARVKLAHSTTRANTR